MAFIAKKKVGIDTRKIQKEYPHSERNEYYRELIHVVKHSPNKKRKYV